MGSNAFSAGTLPWAKLEELQLDWEAAWRRGVIWKRKNLRKLKGKVSLVRSRGREGKRKGGRKRNRRDHYLASPL